MSEALNPFKPVVVHYFTDCAQQDPDATARLQQEITQRFLAVGYWPIVYINGVRDDHEAGLCVADILGRINGSVKTVILANAAPRRDNDVGKPGWHNGTPFGYTWTTNGNLIVSTIGGHALSLLKKVTGNDLQFYRTDITEVAPQLTGDRDEQTWLAATQFRSLDYVPWLAATLLSGTKVPAHLYTDIPDLGDRVVYVDRPFRNVKLGLTLQDLARRGFDLDRPFSVHTRSHTFEVYFYPNGLTTIPETKVGLVPGSSGGRTRGEKLLELQVKNGKAGDILEVEAGDLINIVQAK